MTSNTLSRWTISLTRQLHPLECRLQDRSANATVIFSGIPADFENAYLAPERLIKILSFSHWHLFDLCCPETKFHIKTDTNE